ncbi:MAG TPA: hypothetical protein VKT80_00520, partial [Chloroflexota bacterium]|nr:hypothetical protein [Chloroflexota bacterium]
METGRRFLKLSLSVAVILLAILAFPVRPTHAATNITVLENVVRSSFPQSILFTMRAQSSFQISSVRVAYRVGDSTVTNLAVANFVPDTKVTATYTIDLPRDYLPPGVTVHFQWLIEDMAGSGAATEWSDFKVSDPRFLWHERTLGNVVLHWYDGDDNFADAVLASASKAFTVAQSDTLAPWLG